MRPSHVRPVLLEDILSKTLKSSTYKGQHSATVADRNRL